MIAPARAAFLALALALAAPVFAQGVTARTIVLGQTAPLSGPLQQLGEDLRNGALAYLRQLNEAGGVHGRRIELATLDDAGDPERAMANTRRFIEEFRVFALFGYPEFAVTRELLTHIHQARMPLIAPASGAQIARQPGRAVFAMRAGRADEVDGVIGHFAQLGLKRFALVRRDDAEGTEYLAAARSVLARHELDEPGDAPFRDKATEAVKAALAANPDVVLVALPHALAAEAVRELRRRGRGAQIVVLSPADPVALAKALGPDGAGVALAQVVPPLGQIAMPLVSDFRAAIGREAGSDAGSPAALETYLGAKVFAEAVRRAGPALTREALLKSLQEMSDYDAGGYVASFSRTSRQAGNRVYLMAITRDGRLLH
jgi:branched-chain amino acid transport system substrate-binding protein